MIYLTGGVFALRIPPVLLIYDLAKQVGPAFYTHPFCKSRRVRGVVRITDEASRRLYGRWPYEGTSAIETPVLVYVTYTHRNDCTQK